MYIYILSISIIIIIISQKSSFARSLAFLGAGGSVSSTIVAWPRQVDSLGQFGARAVLELAHNDGMINDYPLLN